MESVIVFKKYANRRLYNTETSKYVTIGDLSALICQGRQVKVIEDKTDIDVTAFTLTQIILEQAKTNNVLLPVPFLHMIIQYGNNILFDFFSNYLTQITRNYLVYKSSMDKQLQQWLELGLGLTPTTASALPDPKLLQNLFSGFSGMSQEGEVQKD